MESAMLLDKWAEPSTLRLTPDTLTILATYKCTAACENCCFGSNPSITHRLGLDDILDFVREGLGTPSLQLVVFSGGECFLLGDDLVRAVEFCTQQGLHTRCVTNGFWAKDLKAGRRRLSELKSAGLKELNISTGDYHQRYVSQDTVINAACLSVEMQITRTVIVVELQKERRVTKGGLLMDPRLGVIARTYRDDRFKIIESPWMPMNYKEVISQESYNLVNRSNLHLRGGCKSLFSTLVLTPHKKIGLCCGLTREKIPELNVVRTNESIDEVIGESGKDFMKIWLSVDGPERILAWAATFDPSIEWENKYGHTCHACLAVFSDNRVRQVIRDHYRERVDDVLMRYVMRLRMKQSLQEIRTDGDFEPILA